VPFFLHVAQCPSVSGIARASDGRIAIRSLKFTTLAPTDTTLDFSDATKAAPPAPARVVESARREAEAGTAQLKDEGFLVSIARKAPARIAPKGADGKYVVLIVEDDTDLGQLLIDIFTLASYEVRWASNRAEINAALRRGHEIDVMLLDVMLPDADGVDVLRRVRGHPVLSTLPVIMITGKSAAEDVSAGLAAGADGYVSKPFKMSGLVKAVGMVLGTN
jgi:two-component system, OmpR family, response regulator